MEFFPNVAAGSKVIISLRTTNYENTDCANLGPECFDTAAREHPEIYSDYMHNLDVVSGRLKAFEISDCTFFVLSSNVPPACKIYCWFDIYS